MTRNLKHPPHDFEFLKSRKQLLKQVQQVHKTRSSESDILYLHDFVFGHTER
jgi:hypothetical protein